MYISFYKLVSPNTAYLVIHLMSSLPVTFPELVQMYIDDHLDEASELYDPSFPWDSAEIHVLYHGLAKMPARVTIPIADGRVMQVVNINPGYTNHFAAVLGDYIPVMEVGRQALLSGCTPVEAAYRLWNYCLERGAMESMTAKAENFFPVVEDMENLQKALLREMGESSVSGGGMVS